MNVTPLDLRQQHFRTVMRGFDKTEVIAFLIEAADDYESALQEADQLRQEVARLQGQVAQLREHEVDLRNTLLTAQRVADDIKEGAGKQAAATVRDAEARATLILERAEARREDVQREIDGLRMKRREAETSVEALVSTLRGTLEFIREQTERDREDRTEKIVLHRPRPLDARDVAMPAWPQVPRDADAETPAAAAR